MSDDVEGGGKGVLSSALLVAAVSAVLLTGFILKNDPSTASARPAASPAPALPLGSTITPDAAPQEATRPEEAAPSAVPAALEAALPPTPAPAPARAPTPARAPASAAASAHAADRGLLELATRADRDRGRLSKAKGRWTAQLVVACKPETVERLIAAGGTSPGLYVLPARVKDDACFRVCYGAYETSKDAAAAADLPKALRGKDKVGAVEIAKVLL